MKTSNGEIIRACPFCGGIKAHYTTTTCDHRIDHRHTVVCECGASSKVAASREEAVAHWNERAGDREPATSKGGEPSTLASVMCSAAFVRKLIDAPANCYKCRTRYVNPTTGMVMNECSCCGGELTPETVRQNGELKQPAPAARHSTGVTD